MWRTCDRSILAPYHLLREHGRMEVHYGVLDGVEVAEPRLTDGVVTLRLAHAGDRAAVAAMDEDAEIRRWVEYRLTPWEEAGNEIAYLQMMWSLRQGVLF